jgi:hypothetical protein
MTEVRFTINGKPASKSAVNEALAELVGRHVDVAGVTGALAELAAGLPPGSYRLSDGGRLLVEPDSGRGNSEVAQRTDRAAQIRERFDAFDAFELLPGEIAETAEGELRPAVALAAAIGGHLHDVTSDAGAPWLGRLEVGRHLAVWRDARGRLWCLLYRDDDGGLYLEPVTPGSLGAGELGKLGSEP